VLFASVFVIVTPRTDPSVSWTLEVPLATEVVVAAISRLP
jgi:hypothetical protein